MDITQARTAVETILNNILNGFWNIRHPSF